MKKLIPLLVGGVLILGLTAGMAPAQTSVATWELVGTAWEGGTLAEANARCWQSVPLATQSCNKQDWEIDVKLHVSVAQWIEFSSTGTRWDWEVRKPGRYVANCISFTIKTNGDVFVGYKDFANPQYVGTHPHPDPDYDLDIDAWYYVSGDANPLAHDSTLWVAAADMAGHGDPIYETNALHYGTVYKLWNMIDVTQCNPACEYQDDATVDLILQNIKDWIDPDTGTWRVG